MRAEGDRDRLGSARLRRWGVALSALALSVALFGSTAVAGPPVHLHNKALDVSGFNHACGVAVDSKGDLYVASAGESKVRVFDPAHTELTFIADVNEPCALAVNSKGELFVSEQATGKVVRYKPNTYPFSGMPTYGAAEPIDSSGNAKGISVDPHDNRLYVAEGTHIAVYKSEGSFETNVGEPTLGEASGVAAYAYKVSEEKSDRYLVVADAAGVAADKLYVFSGSSVANLKLRRTITGIDQDRDPETAAQSFGFGSAGAYLAVDPGNRNAEDKCTSIAEQACTAGHLLLYDAGHEAVDEFEANGEFLDQFTNEDEALADAKPTAMAVDRAGAPNDGTIYVTAGSGAGAKALAFSPLAQPNRPRLEEPLSHVLANARAVATDSRGDVYVAAGSEVHVYGPGGDELTGFPDTHTALEDLAVDSNGRVYVLEHEEAVTYYAPSAYPPASGTSYARHEPAIATVAEFPAGNQTLNAIAVNPGPSAGMDHVFVTSFFVTHEYDSAANGSMLLNPEFAIGLTPGPRQSIGVEGTTGNVYLGENPRRISVTNAAGSEALTKINGAGSPEGQLPNNPRVAVDQSNGHVLAFENEAGAAREYDATGGFVAEFGQFTDSISRPQRIAVDSACATHDPPLTEATTPSCEQFDPADGNVYVAFDDTASNTFDLTAFGPLTYGEAPLAATGIANNVGAVSATLNGTVNPRGFDLGECGFEYLTDAQYITNGKTFTGATSKTCAESLGAIGKGSAPVPVHADITGVSPETTRYRLRLVASSKYGEGRGKAWLFGPPVPTTKPASPILYGEATLRAEVDPSGLVTEYHFEYGKKGAGEYDQSTPVLELPPGDGASAVEGALAGLDEGTEYHFRIVAENEASTVSGSDQAFVTLQRPPVKECPNAEYRGGLSANLPDCRAYELITPAETNGLSPYGASPGTDGTLFDNWLVSPRGAGAGERLSYFTDGTLPGFGGNGRLDGYSAQRGAGAHPKEGWTNELFGPSFEESAPGTLHLPKQRGVSADQLYSFWKMEPEDAFPGTLPEGIYLRMPDGTANPQCMPEPHTQLDFELVGCGSLGTDPEVTSQFLSPDGAHVIFSSKAHLEAATPLAADDTEAIYDRAAGASTATVVSLDPNGGSFGAGENATYVASTEDGSAVVFKVGTKLYLAREGQTTQVAEGTNTFAGISADGQRVFYADGVFSELDAKPADLLACDVEAGPCAGSGAHAPLPIAPNSIFVNVSPDGSHAFFSSEEALTGLSEENENGEHAEASKHNLYAWDAETQGTSFIAQLADPDFEIEGFAAIAGMNLKSWTTAINRGTHRGRAFSPTRATPGGEVLVFQSHARLTSYENEGAGEIYRYEPGAEPGERLTCPSCDPTGAPASGDALLQRTTSKVLSSPVHTSTLIPNITDGGQEIFFQSPDRLLPEDANGVEDVYEWKAKGAGGCERNGGCLALVSSGQGDHDNFLYGMSADGHDVFLHTQEKLVGTDVPGSPSIYDARVEGGIPDPPAKAPCQGDACQGQGSSPPALRVPAITGSGDGNLEELPARCAKGKHRVKGRCVKAHHKRKHRRHRANHNRGARR